MYTSNHVSFYVITYQLENRFLSSCSIRMKTNEFRFTWSCFNNITSLLYDIMTRSRYILYICSLVMTLIDDNINIAIILKKQLKNIIKLWRQKVIVQTKFMLVLIAELSSAIGSETFLKHLSVLSIYRPYKQNYSTSALCLYKI